MKFGAFKEFRQAISTAIEDVVSYLNTDQTKMIRELNIGLTRLSFADNFECFIEETTIAAGVEVSIRNGLRSGQIPRYKIILRSDAGGRDVVDGDSEWNSNYVSLKNIGASSATVTVAFFR